MYRLSTGAQSTLQSAFTRNGLMARAYNIRHLYQEINFFLKTLFIYFCFYFYFFRERGKKGERKGNIGVWEKHQLVASHISIADLVHDPGMCLTGNWTCDLSVCRTMPNPLSHTSWGRNLIFKFHFQSLSWSWFIANTISYTIWGTWTVWTKIINVAFMIICLVAGKRNLF